MEENKHFSHSHSLNHHQVPEGAEITCSGCKSTGTGNVYVCWQCSFYLHEKCFRASRFLKHPSHPSHPLTLVPYPTSPSNSFYCNLCKLTGTGFSYSCASCELDIHVHCAYTELSNQILYPHESILNGMTPNTSSNTNTLPHHLIPNNSHFNSIPVQTPSFNPQYASSHQTNSHHYPIPKREIPSFNDPTGVYTAKAPANTQSSHSSQTGDGTCGIMYFNHNHGLRRRNLTAEDLTNCSACEKLISGSSYSCTKQSCNFHLHKSCFQLAETIPHKSHPNHPLTLLPKAPYEYHGFNCNACSDPGHGFTYHCSICQYDLHVKCASLPETVKCKDHQHVLQLTYSSPTKGSRYQFACDVCHKHVKNDCWTYYCKQCDFGIHPDCVNSKITEDVDLATQLAAVQIKLQLRRMGEENALALLDPPGTTYRYEYDYI